MTAERWNRIQEVFQLALECEPPARAACVEAACRGDDSLRLEVESLLACDSGAHGFLDAAVNRAMDSYRLAAPEFQATPRFDVLGRLGSGGFGAVYRAYDRERHATVALKTLHHLDAGRLLGLKREFRALADISHPNLVCLYELISEAEQCFFAMELVDGLDFREYVARSGRLRETLGQLAQGVCALHAAGKLHRDLKPSNVLVANDGRVVILDFGLITDTGSAGNTEPIAGTPGYMSPEQRAGGPLSEASDWYSVGVMLFEALTGALPAGPDPKIDPREDIAMDLADLCAGLLRREPHERLTGREVCRRLDVAAPEAGHHSRKIRFVGRESQLRALAQAFEAAKSGGTAAVYIHGGSGTGKTALAHFFLDGLQTQQKALVLRGRCYERESVPYKALDNLVDALSIHLKTLPGPDLREISHGVSALGQMFPVLRWLEQAKSCEPVFADVQEQRQQGFAAFRKLLGRLAARTPVVLFIDDLQWGDRDSATLIAELLRPPDAPGVLFVGCYRTEEAGTSPFLQTLAFLQSGGEGVESIDLRLEDLSPPEAQELASALLGGEHGAGRAEQIARHARGNPFFIGELAQHAASSRQGPDPPKEEATIEGLLRARVSLLPAPARRLLEIVAIAGQPIDSAVAGRASEQSEDDRAVLAVLRAGRLIRVRTTFQGQEIETYHDRIRQTLSAGLPAGVVSGLHLRLGEELENSPDCQPDVLAVHFEAAGVRPKALRYAIAAADKAMLTLAFDSAARFYRMALDLEPGEADVVLTLRRKLGEALGNAGRGADAAEAYLSAAALAPAGDALEDRRRAAWQYLISGHVDEGREAIRNLAAATGMNLARSPSRALLSMILGRALINLRGVRFRERAASEIAPAELIRIDTCFSVAQGLGFVDTIHAADFQARHILLAMRAGDKYRAARALSVEAGYHALAGTRRSARTRRVLEAAVKLSHDCGNPHALGFSTLITGTCAFLEGRWKEAEESFAGAEALLLERCAGSVWELATARLQRCACLYFLGEWNRLRERLPVLLADADARGDLYLGTALRTRLGHLSLLAADRPGEAMQLIRGAIAKWSVQGFHTQHCWSLMAQCDILLYQRRGREAWGLIRSHWPLLRKSMLLRIQYFRISLLYYRACTALAMAGESASNIRAATRDASRIEGENTAWGGALTLLIRAAVSAMQHKTENAVQLFYSAEQALDSTNMHLLAAAARRRRGELIGGGEGAALIDTSARFMRGQGIANPESVCDMLAPICPRLS